MRKLTGTIGIVLFLALYAIAVLMLIVKLDLGSAGKVAAFAFYLVAGLSWVIPVGFIIWWMERGPPAN